MNLRQLETFYWAARLGSFVRAAQRLNATQSAVSMRIQEVENHLRVALFDRTQRNARLTPEGTMLLPYAEEVLLAVTRLEVAASPDDRGVSGYVRLGVTENVAVSWLAAMMKALRIEHPLIKIELEIGISYALEEKLYSGTIDMALAACELPASRFHSTPIESIEFRWMRSPGLEGIPAVLTPEALSDLPILSVTREWQASGSLMRWFSDNKIHYRNVTICNTFRTTASLALDGLGLAQLPTGLFANELKTGRLCIVPSEPEVPPLQILAIRPVDNLSPVYPVLVQCAQRASARHWGTDAAELTSA